MNRNIEIHIDELVLEGFDAHDQEGIRDGLQTALSRLFMERGLPQSLSRPSRYPGIHAGDFDLPTGTKPASIGDGIAAMVYAGIENNNSPIKK